MIFDRKKLEKNEEKYLAGYAIKSSSSVGRKYHEEPDEFRMCFQRDKERVIHSKAFRRLDEKTQVVGPSLGDHFRTRLTHTLEVAQIGRDLARRLGLNEDLCEVIALAHDLGHSPFGHAGEDALNEIMSEYGVHFEHNEQSRYIVEKLERTYPDFPGLNLTIEVLDGLIKHQTSYDQSGKEFEFSAHLEAQIVNFSDEIAYLSHDLDDGIRYKIFNINKIRGLKMIKRADEEILKKYGRQIEDPGIYVSRLVSTVIAILVNDLVLNTEKAIALNNINSVDSVKNYKGALARFSDEMKDDLSELREYLYENFYMHPAILSEHKKGHEMIKELFTYYTQNPHKFPKLHRLNMEFPFEIAVKDYISGMTDRFLIAQYENYFGKK